MRGKPTRGFLSFRTFPSLFGPRKGRPYFRILRPQDPDRVAAEVVLDRELPFRHERAGVLDPEMLEDATVLPHREVRLLPVVPRGGHAGVCRALHCPRVRYVAAAG